MVDSEFVAFLKQANTDSSKMAEVIGVSDAQLRFVTNSQSGIRMYAFLSECCQRYLYGLYLFRCGDCAFYEGDSGSVLL